MGWGNGKLCGQDYGMIGIKKGKLEQGLENIHIWGQKSIKKK